MKLEIDLKSKSITSPQFSKQELEEDVFVYGSIDLLYTDNQVIKYPSKQEILAFLKSKFDGTTFSVLQKIEGKYLIIYHLNKHLYIFCDKYSIQRIYYSFQNSRLFLSDNLLADFSNLEISPQNVNQFLFFRFIAGRTTLFEGIFRLMPCDCLVLDLENNTFNIEQHFIYDKNNLQVESLSEAGKQMHHLFREAIQSRIEKYPHETLLLPISGGMDSRYILATLLELVDSKRITTLTFGSKGGYDYEIGKKVAQVAGVRHIGFDLSYQDYISEKDLCLNCVDTEGQINFITEVPFKIIKRYEEYGKVVLSGFVGDTVMGAKTKSEPSSNPFDIVLSDSLVKNKALVQKFLSESTVQSSFYYPSSNNSGLSQLEEWFFINHFNKYTNYCIFKNQANMHYINPFVDYQLNDFMLQLPFEMRNHRTLYFSEICRRFPQLASVPFKTYYGVALNSSKTTQFLAKQWDRFNFHVLKNDKRANYIPFSNYTDKIVKIKALQETMKGILPTELEQLIFQNPKYSLLLFNLKCLEILKTNFNVKFITH